MVNNDARPGLHIISGGLLIWISVAIGPWWIGVMIFLIAWILNLSVMVAKK
jgi:hypothetical protein